jgi:diguanylate cyclase (GGDEF)-like protein/PAS domain S-box-containing protein
VDYLLQAIEAGIDRYVLKPVRTEALVKSLNECAQSVNAEREAQLAASLIASVSEAVVVCDAKGQVVSVNPAYTRATGLSAIEVLGTSVEQLFRPTATQELPWLNEASVSWHGEALIETARQEPFTAWTMYDPVRDRHGHVAYHVIMFYDITERKQAEDKIRLLAHFDALTGLPNRILFDDRLVQAVLSAQRHQETVGLLFVDLDKFKQVNDRHGHIVGDLLLQEVAKRMGDCVRACDTVSRRSGDEFVVLLPAIRDRQDAVMVSERIRLALVQPFVIEGLKLHISASVGIALFPEDADDPRDLFHRADMAMYRAKKAGGNACKSVLVG